MKKSLVIIIPVLIVLVALLLPGAPLESNVAGDYRRTFFALSENISLDKGGKLHQVLTYPDGKQWSADGQWEIDGHSVMLIDCLYYCSDHKMALLNPPKKVMGVRFTVRGHTLSRGREVALERMSVRSRAKG